MPETPYIPESNKGIIHSPEVSEEPTSAQIAEACRGVLSEEDCADIEGMEFGDALGYAFSLLLTNGVEDPETFLAGQGIFEPREEVEGTALPDGLGFVETPELVKIRASLVEALRASQGVIELAGEYQAAAETIVDGFGDYTKGQISLTIQLGLIAREAGRADLYAEYLEQARTYADNLGLDDLVNAIDGMIAEV